MKKTLISAATAVLVSVGGSLFAQEYGAFDYAGNGASQPVAAAPVADAQDESDAQVKCFWGWRWYSCYYYRPTYFYYRVYVPFYRYTYSYRHSYRYAFVRFYKSADVKSATNDLGAMISENPQKGTPLAMLGIAKGDVITHIDGKKLVDPKQLDDITAQSKLVVVKVKSGTNPAGAVAPRAPEVEYGAYEYGRETAVAATKGEFLSPFAVATFSGGKPPLRRYFNLFDIDSDSTAPTSVASRSVAFGRTSTIG